MFGWTLEVVFLTPRSAYKGVTVAVPVLLPGLGSGSLVAVTVATFVEAAGIAPGVVGGRTSAWIVSVWADGPPTATVPTCQTPVPASKLPWLGAADRNCRPAAGNWSVTSTPWATLGPRFESVIVNVTVSPTLGVGSSTVLTTARSAVLAVIVTVPAVV
jgi:hypothetical protein